MAAADATGITLYQASLRTYQLLCYGVSVQIAAGKPHDTVQLVFADNDSQGLRYGTVTSRAEFFVEWKSADNSPIIHGALLDRPLAEMCENPACLISSEISLSSTRAAKRCRARISSRREARPGTHPPA